MPKLKVLSGDDIIKIFTTFGFSIKAQKGSHVKLVRITDDGIKQTLTTPNHSELDKGTLKAIFRQAIRYIPGQDLKPHFYTD